MYWYVTVDFVEEGDDTIQDTHILTVQSEDREDAEQQVRDNEKAILQWIESPEMKIFDIQVDDYPPDACMLEDIIVYVKNAQKKNKAEETRRDEKRGLYPQHEDYSN